MGKDLAVDIQETLKCIFTLKFMRQYRFLNLSHFYFYPLPPLTPKVTGNSKLKDRGLTTPLIPLLSTGLSQAYLWHISGKSQEYLRKISIISQAYLRYIACISQVYIRNISKISQANLRHILDISQIYLMYISGIF